MPQIVIENPVLNSPFDEPKRHFRFDEDGITNEIVEARRVSSYFVPIPRPKKKSPTMLNNRCQKSAWRNMYVSGVHGRVRTPAGQRPRTSVIRGSALLTRNIAALAKMRRVTQGVIGA